MEWLVACGLVHPAIVERIIAIKTTCVRAMVIPRTWIAYDSVELSGNGFSEGLLLRLGSTFSMGESMAWGQRAAHRWGLMPLVFPFATGRG